MKKKRNHTVQKILTIFDQNGTFLPIVHGKILAKKAAWCNENNKGSESGVKRCRLLILASLLLAVWP